MKNKFQQYVNDLLNLLTTFSSFSDKRKFSYLYKNFDIPKEHQEIFLSTLISKQVIERCEKIHQKGLLSTHFEMMQKINGELGYGWELKIDREKLNIFLNENKHISITNEQEIYFKPSLSEDGKTLYINGNTIKVVAKNSPNKDDSDQAILAKLLFNSDTDLYTSKNDFVKSLTGDTPDIEGGLVRKYNKRMNNAIYQLNKKIYAETKLDKYIKVASNEIFINKEYIEP